MVICHPVSAADDENMATTYAGGNDGDDGALGRGGGTVRVLAQARTGSAEPGASWAQGANQRPRARCY